MKKSILFPILALILCIGFSSCKPNGKEYTCYFKVERQTSVTDDSTLRITLEEEHLGILNSYMQVFDADRGFNFRLTATDETELEAKISELNKQVEEQLSSAELHGFYIVRFFMPKDEKESTEIFSTKIGTPLYAGSTVKIYNLVNEDGLDEDIPMSSGISYIGNIELDNWGSLEYKWENNLVIKEDLNQNAGGKHIFIHASSKNHLYAPITDVIVLNASGKRGSDFTYRYNGRLYYRVNPYDDNLNGDLNQSAGGDYLYLMYTRDSFEYNHRLVNMCIYSGENNFTISESDMGNGIVAVPMIQEGSNDTLQSQADLNYKAEGNWIRMLCKYN